MLRRSRVRQRRRRAGSPGREGRLPALGAAVAILLACGAVALLVPVRRATRADPVAVMR